MGCCIIGALIISRWLYVFKRMGLSLTSFRSGVMSLVGGCTASRRTALLAACVCVEMALLATVAAHELKNHSHDGLSLAHAVSVIATTNTDAICSGGSSSLAGLSEN
jgi:hypothetical protein